MLQQRLNMDFFEKSKLEEATDAFASSTDLNGERGKLMSTLSQFSHTLPTMLGRNKHIVEMNEQLEQMTNDAIAGKRVDIPRDFDSRWQSTGDIEQGKSQLLERQMTAYIYEQWLERTPKTRLPATPMTQGGLAPSCSPLLLQRLMEELPESYRKGSSSVPALTTKLGQPPFPSMETDLVNVPGVGPCSASGIETIKEFLRSGHFSTLNMDSLCDVLSTIDPFDNSKIEALSRHVDTELFDPDQDATMMANLEGVLRMTMASFGHGDSRGHESVTSFLQKHDSNNAWQQPRKSGRTPPNSGNFQPTSWDSNYFPETSQDRGVGNANCRNQPLPLGFVHPSASLPKRPPPAPPRNCHEANYAPCALGQGLPVPRSPPIPVKLAPNSRRLQPLTSDALTLIVKKIPARITPTNLLELWPAYGSYNLLYLPYNHRTRRTAGFVIVNFVSNEAAVAFRQRWQGQFLLHESSVKKLDICVAEVQGLIDNLVAMKKNKKINRMKNDRYLPVIIQPDGTPADFKTLMESIQLPPDQCQKDGDGNGSSDAEFVEMGHFDDDDVPNMVTV